jgi:hypothetical protein
VWRQNLNLEPLSGRRAQDSYGARAVDIEPSDQISMPGGSNLSHLGALGRQT